MLPVGIYYTDGLFQNKPFAVPEAFQKYEEIINSFCKHTVFRKERVPFRKNGAYDHRI